MRNSIQVSVALAAVCVLIAFGCGINTVSKVAQADAVAIPTVNAAMTAWASYVNAGKATAAQVTTVSNAYSVYYQSQLTASNAAVLYASNPSTNTTVIAATALQAALASETNIIAIVQQLTK